MLWHTGPLDQLFLWSLFSQWLRNVKTYAMQPCQGFFPSLPMCLMIEMETYSKGSFTNLPAGLNIFNSVSKGTKMGVILCPVIFTIQIIQAIKVESVWKNTHKPDVIVRFQHGCAGKGPCSSFPVVMRVASAYSTFTDLYPCKGNCMPSPDNSDFPAQNRLLQHSHSTLSSSDSLSAKTAPCSLYDAFILYYFKPEIVKEQVPDALRVLLKSHKQLQFVKITLVLSLGYWLKLLSISFQIISLVNTWTLWFNNSYLLVNLILLKCWD